MAKKKKRVSKNKPITRKYKTIDFNKLYGRDKVVNNQFLLEFQSLESLKEFVSKRGNFAQVGETYEEVVSQAFKVARGIRYKDERKFVNPRYRGKGDQQKVALSNELNVSIANLRKQVKIAKEEDKERGDMVRLAKGNKTSLIGEIAHQNKIRAKEIMDFTKEMLVSSGMVNSKFDESYKSYKNLDEKKRDEKADKAALRRFNRYGHTWGLYERTLIVQENLVEQILKGNSTMGIEGDPELAALVASLDVKEIYALTLNKDFDVLFITSEPDVVKETETSMKESMKETRRRILESIKKYVKLKNKGRATPKDFAEIVKIEPQEYIFSIGG